MNLFVDRNRNLEFFFASFGNPEYSLFDENVIHICIYLCIYIYIYMVFLISIVETVICHVHIELIQKGTHN